MKGGDCINDVFLALPEEKRTRILDAAFEEFSANDYRHASTNRIAERAGIAKGMLFYYFGSKEALYDDLIEQALSFVEEAILPTLSGADDADFISLCVCLSRAKAKAMAERPQMFYFLSSFVLRPDALHGRPEVSARIARLAGEARTPLYAAIARTPLRPDVPRDVSAKFIRYVLSGYEAELTERFRGKELQSLDLKPYWDEYDAFITHIRTIFCK